MRPLREVVRDKSAVSLFREALWRTRREWNKAQFLRDVEGSMCPVVFEPVGYYQPDLNAIDSESRRVLLDFAELTLAGQFVTLGHDSVHLGFPPPWNLDFVSNTSFPITASASYNYVRHDGSDIKAVWELSRLQSLPVLAKAYRVSDDERYRQAARDLCSDWIARNPVGTGPNWTVAMEASLRAMSMCFLLELMWPVRSGEQEWVNIVTQSLWQHLRFIESHLEFSHLFRSNHYLSNALGLFCLSLYLHGPGRKPRLKTYWDRFQAEVLHQTYEDGGDFESSLGYQVLTTQMAATGLLLARAAKLNIAADFVTRTRRMFRVLEATADDHGRLPQIGDCDDGRVELLQSDLEQMLRKNSIGRDSLRVPGFLAFGTSLDGEASRWNSPDAAWYGLPTKHQANAEPRPDSARVFQQSGIAIARSGDLQLTFLAIPNGISGKGSHTHNDKLSVLCRVNNSDLLIDPGTACYTRDALIRNRFRSTPMHNTICVDEMEQNTIFKAPNTLFCLGNEASVSAIECNKTGDRLSFVARHRGYEQIGVIHARTVRLNSDREILIEDVLQGDNRHKFELNFHFGEGWTPQLTNDSHSCWITGPRTATLRFSSETELRLSIKESHISRSYGSVSKTHKLVVSGESVFPIALSTQISIS